MMKRFSIHFALAVFTVIALPDAQALAQDREGSLSSGSTPRLVFGLIGDASHGPRARAFTEYLQTQVGAQISARFGSCEDIINGQVSGTIDVAEYCGASYFARALSLGAPIEPFAIEVNHDGSIGYHSVFYVRQNSAYKTIQDLKGKTLALVRKDSTSGDLVPRYTLHKQQINPATFFSKVIYTGDHHGFVEPMRRGQIDVAATTDSTADVSVGRPLINTLEFRAILKSDLIPNPPLAYRTALPDDLRKKVREAVLEIGQRNPDAFAKLMSPANRPVKPWQSVAIQTYASIIEMMAILEGKGAR